MFDLRALFCIQIRVTQPRILTCCHERIVVAGMRRETALVLQLEADFQSDLRRGLHEPGVLQCCETGSMNPYRESRVTLIPPGWRYLTERERPLTVRACHRARRRHHRHSRPAGRQRKPLTKLTTQRTPSEPPLVSGLTKVISDVSGRGGECAAEQTPAGGPGITQHHLIGLPGRQPPIACRLVTFLSHVSTPSKEHLVQHARLSYAASSARGHLPQPAVLHI